VPAAAAAAVGAAPHAGLFTASPAPTRPLPTGRKLRPLPPCCCCCRS
jgi:hypothetical protein